MTKPVNLGDETALPSPMGRPPAEKETAASPEATVRVTTPERSLWYVETLFAYTNQLMERTQARCNYLIFSNSVASVAFFTLLNALLSNRGRGHYLLTQSNAIALALLPAALLLGS